MFGCEHDRPHSGLLRQRNDFARIECSRIKHVCSFCIPVTEYAGKGLDLLAIAASYWFTFPDSSQVGIKSEVDEHGVFVVLPLFKSVGRCILGHRQERQKD